MMKKMRKSILAFAIILVILAGCSTKAPESTQDAASATAGSAAKSETQAAKEPVTLRFWFLGTSDKDVQEMKKHTDSFTEKNPNIKIELTGMSTTISEYETKLNAAVLSDTYPDVLHIVLAQVGSRGALGDFEPLEPYIQTWEDKDDIFKSAYDMGKYEGKQIAIGCAPDPKINVYRKDFFKEAGLDPDDPPSTWAELAYAAEKLTIRDKNNTVIRAGLAIPAVDSSLVFTEPFLRSSGSMVIDEINLKPSFTDEGAIKALQFLGDLAAKNVYIPFDLQNAQENPFLNNKAAMATVSIAPLKDFLNANPDIAKNVGYMPIWSVDGTKPGVAFCGYQLYAMGARSKHKQEAWEFIKHMMSPEVLWQRSQERSFPPVRYSLEDKFIEQDPELNTAVIEYVKNGKGKAAVSWISIFNKYVSVAYEEVINQKKTAEQALKDAEKALLAEIS